VLGRLVCTDRRAPSAGEWLGSLVPMADQRVITDAARTSEVTR
jgi:hypothetical protein